MGLKEKGELAMKLRNALGVAISAAVIAISAGGCSRDHIEAINLANEGDRSVKVSVEGAIQKYEEARQLDPANHQILWKLAKAFEKKEDWEKMAGVLSAANQQAPTYANYWFSRGYALIRQAEAGKADAYVEAKVPLKECIKADPNFAECYHFLGEAEEWTDNIQEAVANYAKAIEHDPSVGFFYPALASVLITYKMYGEAEAVLKEGARVVPLNESTKNNIYEIYVLMFQVAQARDDKSAMLAAAEHAEKSAGDAHPEISFTLGSTYAIMEPPQKEKAVRLLKSFTKRGCASAQAKKFKEQCETAATLLQQLGGQG